MVNLNRFAVNRFRSSDDLAAKMLPDRLMAETYAKDRQAIGKPLYHPKRDASRIRRPRPRRDQDTLRFEVIFYLIHRDLVIANNAHLGPKLAQILHEVVGERIVIVDYE